MEFGGLVLIVAYEKIVVGLSNGFFMGLLYIYIYTGHLSI